MIDFSHILPAISWSIVWQSTLCLAIGGLASLIWARRPARADGLLVAGMLATLAAPIGTFLILQRGWGVLPLQTNGEVTASIALAFSPQKHTADALPGYDAETAPQRSIGPPSGDPQFQPPLPPQAAVTPSDSTSSKAISIPSRQIEIDPARKTFNWAVSWRVLLGCWSLLSTAALARLVMSFWAGRRLVMAATRVSDPRLESVLSLAAERLGLGALATACVSSRVRCPVIWCWSRRPIVLLPVSFFERANESAWLGIFCHELAHWKRNDHVTSLAGQVLCCAFPWQPLAWWTRRRHEKLSELACDEWVVATGYSPENYAEALIDLVPQRDLALALAILRNRAGLMARIQHILQIQRAQPRLGSRWIAGLAALTLCLVAIVAIAQQRPPTAVAEVAKPHLASEKSEPPQASGKQPESQRVGGVVRDAADKPVAGARVYWVGLSRARWGTLPHNDPRKDSLIQFAEGVTDDQGNFSLAAIFTPRVYQFMAVLVRSDQHGLGLRSYLVTDESDALKVQLPASTPIEGRILTASGTPVAGAEILPTFLNATTKGAEKDWGWLELPPVARRGGQLPSFWPKPVKTGADGRFTLPGNDNTGFVLLRVAAQGFGPHGVAVADGDTIAKLKEYELKDQNRVAPLENNFTLVLEPPRTVEGTITDAETGRPISGVEVIMESASYHTMPNRQSAQSRTDDEGRYHFVLPSSGDQNQLLVFPPQGYIATGKVLMARDISRFFAMSRVHRYDVRLTSGRLVPGRVIDADTHEPICDARITYQAGRGNSRRDLDGNFWMHEPVLTDDRGTFQVTALTGPGIIQVEMPSDEYVRTTIPRELLDDGTVLNPHAFVNFDLSVTEALPSIELAVHRGIDLVIEPVGPDGKPVSNLLIACRESDVVPTHGTMSSHPVREMPVRLPGCRPGNTYRLLLGTDKGELGAVAVVTCDPAAGPLKVTMQPTGTLRGKLVYTDGNPASDINIFLNFHDDPDAAKKMSAQRAQNLPYYNNVMRPGEGSRSTTDAEGEFEMRGIVPGVFLYLTLNYEFPSGERHHPAGTVEPGKTLDLGQLEIRPR